MDDIIVLRNGYDIVRVGMDVKGLVSCISAYHVWLNKEGENCARLVDVFPRRKIALSELPPLEKVVNAMGHFHGRLGIEEDEFFDAINRPLPDPPPALEHAVAFLKMDLYWPCCWIGVVDDIHILILPDPIISSPYQIRATLHRWDKSFSIARISRVEHIPPLLEASKLVPSSWRLSGVMEGDIVYLSILREGVHFTFSIPVESIGALIRMIG